MATCVGRCLVGKAVQPLQSVKSIRIAASSIMDTPSTGLVVSVCLKNWEKETMVL